MFANNVKFNPFRLCIHNFQYMSIRFQVFKFDIDVVLFSKKFHKAFVLILGVSPSYGEGEDFVNLNLL